MSEKTELCGFLPGLIQGYITFSVSPLESQNNFVISLLNKHESDPLYTKSGRNLVLLTQSQGKVYVRYVMHQGMKSGATVTGIIVRKMLGLFYLSSCFRHSGLCFEVSIQAQNDWNLLSMWLGIGEDLLSDNLKPVTEELWIVLFIEKMLSGYQQVKLLRAENDVESGKLRSLHYTFPLTLLQAQTPACEKNSFFPKSPEVHLCVEVRSWLGWHSCRFLLRQGVAKKYVCVFRTHPEVLRGQGKGWDGNLDREVGELVWDPEAISLLPGISQCWKLQLERDSALTGTFRFLLHKKFCWMITHFRYYRQKCGRAGYKTDD